MTETLDWALFYARLGWPVFPVQAGGKLPVTEHGFKDASTDPVVVAGWFEDHPRWNIGLATGHGFDVLDLDGAAGLEHWDELTLENDLGVPFDAVPVVGTPSGGQHWYFKPTGAGNRAKMLKDRWPDSGLDWRGLGGYVVAPPSTGANGERYRWADDDPSSLVPAAAPGWLVDIVAPKPSVARTGAFAALGMVGRFGEPSRYGQAAVEQAVAAIRQAGEGARNDTLNREAFSLFGLVAGGEIPDDGNVEQQLGSAAQAAGLAESEIRATLNSARRAGLAVPRSAPPRRQKAHA